MLGSPKIIIINIIPMSWKRRPFKWGDRSDNPHNIKEVVSVNPLIWDVTHHKLLHNKYELWQFNEPFHILHYNPMPKYCKSFGFIKNGQRDPLIPFRCPYPSTLSNTFHWLQFSKLQGCSVTRGRPWAMHGLFDPLRSSTALVPLNSTGPQYVQIEGSKSRILGLQIVSDRTSRFWNIFARGSSYVSSGSHEWNYESLIASKCPFPTTSYWLYFFENMRL